MGWRTKEDAKNYYLKNKEWIKKRQHELQQEYRRKAFSIIGDRCIICDSKNRTKSIGKHRNTHCFHEIYGKSHKTNSMSYILKYPKRFVLVCRQCHKWIHVLMDVFNLNWEEIKLLRDKLRNG